MRFEERLIPGANLRLALPTKPPQVTLFPKNTPEALPVKPAPRDRAAGPAAFAASPSPLPSVPHLAAVCATGSSKPSSS